MKRKKEADFDSFVAFDFETTGVNSNRDAIIEVGAIRVVNGRLNRSPSSRQLKKYKIFLPVEIYLLAVFMRLFQVLCKR